jgi:NAD(P)-dependent dehydrogenase (short-subunit alcohol dehydrogenase family)
MAADAVVVTGASTGIGRATALHLAARGFEVYAGVRREADAHALRDAAPAHVHPLRLDVADAATIVAAGDAVAAGVEGAGLAGLVNNAGITIGGPLEFLDLDALRRQLEVNVVGAVAVTQRMLPLLRARRGRVVNVSSVGGRVPPPFIAPYAASKAALATLSDSLRRELRPWGIWVAVIEPGAIATPMWDKGAAQVDERLGSLSPEERALYGAVLPRMREVTARSARRAVPPERVAKVIEHALTASRPRGRYLVGPDARVQAALRHLPARASDALVARIMRLP